MVGAAFAFPMNWWLIAHHLKHGMLTVRPKGEASAKMDVAARPDRPSISPPGSGDGRDLLGHARSRRGRALAFDRSR
jgi:hypothetical protein